MTAKITDMQVLEEFQKTEGHVPTTDEVYGFFVAEALFLPQIQQLHGEIERLSQSNISLKETAYDIAKKAQSEREKHEALVKGLKEIPIYDKKEMDWAVDGTKWILKYSIDNLLTESEDK